VAFLGPGLDRLIFALASIGWVGYSRMARGQVLKVKILEFVEAALAWGMLNDRQESLGRCAAHGGVSFRGAGADGFIS
jgi:ABC-type microcin C transport system permease subunit YejE